MTETFHAGPNLGRLSDVTIIHGDCIEAMAELAADSVDAIVTDPPYGLGFMGKAWDGLPPGLDWAKQCHRVLKPGGHLLAFGGTRTWHRLAVAVEDAGFEIRDSIAWLYGSGFPKSLDVSKAIDKAAGAEREVTGVRSYGDGHVQRSSADKLAPPIGTFVRSQDDRLDTAPATPEAEQWSGWGTALKPAMEIICVARKPFSGTVASNVLKWGTGAINIDACRITSSPAAILNPWELDENLCGSCAERAARSGKPGTPAIRESTATRPAAPTMSARGDESQADTSKTDTGCSDGTRLESTSTSSSTAQSGSSITDPSLTGSSSTTSTTTHSTTESRTCNSCHAPLTPRTITKASNGRWPSNVVLDADQAAALDEQSGTTKSATAAVAKPMKRQDNEVYGKGLGSIGPENTYTDSGGASRFFLNVEPDPDELEDLDVEARFRYVAKAPKKERPVVDGVAHPTVKPLALMRWLVRLVTPPGGVVLDPFSGSGTTVEAALLEDFRVIGIEREADYLPMIQQRIARSLR